MTTKTAPAEAASRTSPDSCDRLADRAQDGHGESPITDPKWSPPTAPHPFVGSLMAFRGWAGHTRTDANPLGLDPGLAPLANQHGAIRSFIADRYATEIMPLVEGGFGGFVSHLKFGNEGETGVMDLDGLADAKERGFGALDNAHLSGMSAVRDRFAELLPDGVHASIIDYNGKPEEDIRALIGDGKAPQAWRRAEMSVTGSVEAGLDIAFDGSVIYPIGSFGETFYQATAHKARWFGGMVYLEALPRPDMGVGVDAGFGLCLRDADYRGMIERRESEFGAQYAASIRKMNTVRWVTYSGDGDTANNDKTASMILAAWTDGHRVAISTSCGLIKEHGPNSLAILDRVLASGDAVPHGGRVDVGEPGGEG